MDTKSPYTGDQSPLIKLDKEPRRLGQPGIAVRKGNVYAGRICAGRLSRRVSQVHAHLGEAADRGIAIIHAQRPTISVKSTNNIPK